MVDLPELLYYGQEFCNAYSKLDDERGGAVLMQFTGLKDKNGKEIFEGDIVDISHGVGKVIFPVQWTDNPRGGWFPFSGTTYINTPRPEDVIVIGNIYENPDLISNS